MFDDEIKFVDLSKENKFYKKIISKNISNILDSGIYLFGNFIEKLEYELSVFSNKKYAVAVKNATDAITLTLKKIYKPGMKVILPNFGAYPTAIATLNVVKNENLYYVDVDRTMTINPNCLPDIKNGIVIFVALFGNNGNIEKIEEFCKTNNNILVVDAAQSTGSGIEKYGDYLIYSFYPTKPLSACGDGGMILSNNNLDIIKKLRFYGVNDNKIVMSGGINSRMDEIQSSIIFSKIPYFMKLSEKRKSICGEYLKIVSSIDWKENSVFHQFPILVTHREEVFKILNNLKIPYMIHYHYHITDFECMRGSYNNVNYRINDKILSIPCHSFLNKKQIKQIKKALTVIKDYECR